MSTHTAHEPTETVLLPAGRRGEEDAPEHRLRDVAPVGAAALLLFGLLMAGAFLLRDVVDLGLWLVSSR